MKTLIIGMLIVSVIATAVVIILLANDQRATIDIALIQRDIFSIYEQMSSILRPKGIIFWNIGGSLLGSVRARSLIPWDDDGDVFMPSDHIDAFKATKDAFHATGIELLEYKSPYKVQFKLRKNHAFIDIFIVEIQTDKYVAVEKAARLRWPNNWFFVDEVGDPFENMLQLGSTDVPSPQNPKPYLLRHYGDDWETPKFTHNHNDTIWIGMFILLIPIVLTIASIMFFYIWN
jgi:hypothetical protein